MTRPLLVVAHEATRTGSPSVLLRQLRFAGPRIEVPIAVRLLAGGPLEDDLRRLATADRSEVRPAAILVNSAAAAGCVFDYDEAIPVLAYVHEEGDALRLLPEDARRGLVERCGRVLCVSESAKGGLVALGVPIDRIAVIPPAILAIDAPDAARVAHARVMAGLEADRGQRLVLACGEAGWRKGADLFVDVARRIADLDASVRFAWVGRRPRMFARVLDHDTRALGLDATLRWLGEMADVVPFLAAADVLVMCSREDPQPLVPLEAALLGVPTVGFDAGGMAELGAGGAAAVVAYPDSVALARRAVDLLDDPAERAELVAGARRRVAETQAIEVVGPQFLRELSDVIGRGRAGVS